MVAKEKSYIFDAKRSPMFKSTKGKRKGNAHELHSVKLGSAIVKNIVEENNLPEDSLDDLMVGCATPTGKQGFNVGRLIAYDAVGEKLPGTQINRLCGSGAEAVKNASALTSSGISNLIIAGGLEHMSAVPMGADMMPPLAGMPDQIFKTFFRIIKLKQLIIKDTLPKDFRFFPMGLSGDLIAKKFKLKRSDLDKFALASQQKASLATKSGRFKREIVPIEGSRGLIGDDEGIRPTTTLEGLAGLPPSFGTSGLHTAGNSSQITDGAAFILVGNDEAKEKYGLKPKAKIIHTVVIGSDVKLQLTGPIQAIDKLLKESGYSVDDIDLFEINEAFASVVLATINELKIDPNKVNVNGGAIALGHPLGCSGARLLVTLLHELERRDLKLGVSALCIGGGQAIATLIERV